jgi:hypothetical protein
MENGTKDLMDTIVAGAAVLALLVSFISLGVSLFTAQLSNKQEQRRHLRLVPHLMDSYFRIISEGDREYSFLLSINNPSDADNSIALVEMHLTYLLPDQTKITVKLPSRNLARSTGRGIQLETPKRIAAHDTVSGWCHFIIGTESRNGRSFDSFKIVISDTHMAATSVNAALVREEKGDD